VTAFGRFVARASARGELVVQPRMGFSDLRQMRAGLLATKAAAGTTAGTLTLDSYTRTGNDLTAAQALAGETDLNGYPLVAHGAAVTRALLDGVADSSFPVQVRHGSASPHRIFQTAIAAGLYATEGGPVSYCLPYSRAPLQTAVADWAACCDLLAATRSAGIEPHLETFGGCMLGQLCPPGLLVALSTLEALFFRQHGLRSVSLSYAQQTSDDQDAEAIRALRRLAAELLADTEWHVVLYAYMGVYPTTRWGARSLLTAAAGLARSAGAERLIVKTVSEAHRIPTIAENVEALELAAAEAAQPTGAGPVGAAADADNEVYGEARAIVDAVLGLDGDVGAALIRAFGLGLLDVPYCLHDDNRGESRSYIDRDGRLRWARVGSIPVPRSIAPSTARPVTSSDLITALQYVRRRFDRARVPAVTG
jgi:methylaspartate mutase epsilon subunit